MNKFLFFIFVFVGISFAGDDTATKDYDIVWRTINFAIFFGILFYLIKGPIKNAYNARINRISSRLEAIQIKLKESKEKKEASKKNLEDVKQKCVELIETAKKEAIQLDEKIQQSAQIDIAQMQKSFAEQKEFEIRRLKKSVTAEILDELFSEKSVNLSQNELINLVQKKVV